MIDHVVSDLEQEAITLVKAEVGRLDDLARRSSNSSVLAMSQAANHAAVQTLLTHKIKAGNTFEGISMMKIEDTGGEVGVLFLLEPPPAHSISYPRPFSSE
ncbi:MAG TPA: hypothetical protein VGY31_01890 [Terriglobia bacterium]|nr:hypothetical protein [Terriglobia bacterium]